MDTDLLGLHVNGGRFSEFTSSVLPPPGRPQGHVCSLLRRLFHLCSNPKAIGCRSRGRTVLSVTCLRIGWMSAKPRARFICHSVLLLLLLLSGLSSSALTAAMAADIDLDAAELCHESEEPRHAKQTRCGLIICIVLPVSTVSIQQQRVFTVWELLCTAGADECIRPLDRCGDLSSLDKLQVEWLRWAPEPPGGALTKEEDVEQDDVGDVCLLVAEICRTGNSIPNKLRRSENKLSADLCWKPHRAYHQSRYSNVAVVRYTARHLLAMLCIPRRKMSGRGVYMEQSFVTESAAAQRTSCPRRK
ncbi:unnamed protein product [Pleuronectes platessa]|uniref:Uncharacterized protein n=1 Tax=Pleuronectes platessa TaxID=8262 RepID=A0A9N7YG80_PLEPL|nr:unnamed protein product [Pleuronectes platessa]